MTFFSMSEAGPLHTLKRAGSGPQRNNATSGGCTGTMQHEDTVRPPGVTNQKKINYAFGGLKHKNIKYSIVIRGKRKTDGEIFVIFPEEPTNQIPWAPETWRELLTETQESERKLVALSSMLYFRQRIYNN